MILNAGSPLDLLMQEVCETVLAYRYRLLALLIVNSVSFVAMEYVYGIRPWTVLLVILNCTVATLATGIVSKMSLAEYAYVPELLEESWASSAFYFIGMVAVSVFLAVLKDINY